MPIRHVRIGEIYEKSEKIQVRINARESPPLPLFLILALLFLPSVAFAQVSERASSTETDLKKMEERGWEENLNSTKTILYLDDTIPDERLQPRPDASELFHDRFGSEKSVTGVSAAKPVAHVNVSICGRDDPRKRRYPGSDLCHQ